MTKFEGEEYRAWTKAIAGFQKAARHAGFDCFHMNPCVHVRRTCKTQDGAHLPYWTDYMNGDLIGQWGWAVLRRRCSIHPDCVCFHFMDANELITPP